MTAAPARTRPWSALLVLCVANFLILLDTTIVNTALPDIQRTLDAGIDEALWVLNGFLLAFASLLIVSGRLGDLIGPRTVFVAGLELFTVASVLCGLSRSAEELVAARVLQGVGAAALLPQALVLITAIFPAERRGAAFGIFTAVAGIASVSGPTVGGLLITEFGWQSIFYLNVPFGVLGIVLAYRLVPRLSRDTRTRGRPGRRHRFDLVGVLLATAGLSGIAYGLVEGQRHDWGRVLGPVTVPVVLTGAAGLLYVLETQAALGMSPLASGLSALPWTVTLSAVAPVAGRLADRIGGRILLIAGLALLALGVACVAFLPTTTSTPATFALPLILVGAGIGLTVAPTTTEAMRAVAPEQTGAASGVLNTARQVGAVIGAAVVGAVLQNRLTSSLHREAAERVAQLPPDARGPYLTGFDAAAAHGLQLGNGQSGGVSVPPGLAPGMADHFGRLVHEAFGAAFLSATRPTLTVVAAVVLVGCLLAVLMTGRRPAAPTAAGGPATSLAVAAGHDIDTVRT